MIFPGEPDMLASIMRLQSQLSELIEPDFGLLDELLILEVLTRRQVAKVRSGDKILYERNDALLDLLTSEDQCDKFLTALERTGQKHVVNFITQNGGQRDNNFTTDNIAKKILVMVVLFVHLSLASSVCHTCLLCQNG